MNEQYWIDGARECLDAEGITATDEQIERIGKRLASGAEVEAECTGLAARTKPSVTKAKTPEQLKIERLEYAVSRLAARLGVGVDIDRREISYMTPVGTAHMGTTTAPL